MSGMGDGYVGTAQDAVRIRRLEKQREAERKKIRELKSKSASTQGQPWLLQFGSSTSESLKRELDLLRSNVQEAETVTKSDKTNCFKNHSELYKLNLEFRAAYSLCGKAHRSLVSSRRELAQKESCQTADENKMDRRPFFLFVKIPRFEDDDIKEKIKFAQQEIDDMSKLRDSYKVQIQTKKAVCDEFDDELEAAKL